MLRCQAFHVLCGVVIDEKRLGGERPWFVWVTLLKTQSCLPWAALVAVRRQVVGGSAGSLNGGF